MDEKKDDGLTKVTLGKDWGDHKPGETLRVDPQRARQLREDGFLEPMEDRPQKPKGARARG